MRVEHPKLYEQNKWCFRLYVYTVNGCYISRITSVVPQNANFLNTLEVKSYFYFSSNMLVLALVG